MKTFKNKISNYAKRTRAGERAATFRVVESMLSSLDGRKWEQAGRILTRKKTNNEDKITGPFSGLTRQELAMSGTSEADWF